MLDTILKALDLLYKVVKGRSDRNNIDILIAESYWDCCFDIPAYNNRYDYAVAAETNDVFFKINITISTNFTTNIHSYRAFFISDNEKKVVELWEPELPFTAHAKYFENTYEQTFDFNQYIEVVSTNISGFQPFDLEKDKSKHLSFLLHGQVQPCYIDKQFNAHVLLVFQLKTRFLQLLIRLPGERNKVPKICIHTASTGKFDQQKIVEDWFRYISEDDEQWLSSVNIVENLRLY